MKSHVKYNLQYFYRPGETMKDDELAQLNRDLRRVASTCFDKLPDYQCLSKGREALRDKAIVLARQPGGPIEAFSSALLLPVDDVGEVLHLGLTCVHPAARGNGLTHQLTSHLLRRMLLGNPLKGLWITNVGCELSSLGNVAINFDEVFPSPYSSCKPSETHLKIADTIDKFFRAPMAIRKEASFCPQTFLFKESVKGTIFQKSEEDKRFHHRNPSINTFYKELMSFENGDEILQIGYVSALTYARYMLRNSEKQVITAALDLLKQRDVLKI